MIARGWTALVWIAALAVPARAGETAEQRWARQLSDEGLAHFQQAHYREAIAEFSASYALRPLPALLFNIAQAHRLSGDCAEALEFYRSYRRDLPDAPNRPLVEGLVAEMERCPRAPPPPPIAPARASPSVARPIAPPPRPLYRRWWLWTAVAAVAAAAAIAVGVALETPPSPSLGTVRWQ